MPALYDNIDATDTGISPPGTISVEAPWCGGPALQDVWSSVIIPPNGELRFNTEPMDLEDAGLAAYRQTSGDCITNDLVLMQIAGGCASAGSDVDPNMPALDLTGLVPGERIWLRVWRETGNDGTFTLCTNRTDSPLGQCDYVLSMTDSGADGWGGSSVLICVDPLGPPTAVCTSYTISATRGNIAFGADLGSTITLNYTSVGGLQNEIAHQLATSGGGILYGSESPPSAGLVYAFTVNSVCNVPPAPATDCVGSHQLLWPANVVSSNPTGSGAVEDLIASNQGCLVNGEANGIWYRLYMEFSGQLVFSIDAGNGTAENYDFALWGPLPSETCPPTEQPIRCSFAGTTDATGLNFSASDISEDFTGDGWVSFLPVLFGQQYMLYVSAPDSGHVAHDLSHTLPTTNGRPIVDPGSVDRLMVFPNPASDGIALHTMFSVSTECTADVVDATGRVVIRSRFNSSAGITQLPLDISGLGAGSYTIRMTTINGLVLGQARFAKASD